MAEIFKLSNRKIKEVQDELKDLKEALYGYVLDTAQIETTGAIPQTVTIGSGTYNLVDNVRGLVKSINGESKVNYSNYENSTSYNFTIATVESGTYTISLKNNGSGTVAFNLCGVQSSIILESGQYFTKTTTFTETTEIKMNCYTGAANFSDISVVKGNIASPYFASIKSVIYEGLKVTGVNLCSSYSKGDWRFYFDAILAPNTTYTFSSSNSNSASNVTFLITDVNNNTYTLWSDTYAYSMSEFAFTTPSIVSGLCHCECRINKSDIGDIQNVSLVKGNTAPTTFKPYKAPVTILPFNATTLRGANEVKDKIVITKNANDDYYTATKVTNVGFEMLDGLNFTYDTQYGGYWFANYNGVKTLGAMLSELGLTTYNNFAQWAAASSGQVLVNNSIRFKGIGSTTAPTGWLHYELDTPTTTVLSATLTEADVMPLLELGGSVEVLNNNSAYVQGSTVIEMVYKLINTDTASVAVQSEEEPANE